MIAFIDEHRQEYGSSRSAGVLPIAPSTYHERAARRRDPSWLPARARRDDALEGEVRRMLAENFGVYSARKVWQM